jgi:hypothetical protein
MHSGERTEHAWSESVIPAYAGIQFVVQSGPGFAAVIPAYAGIQSVPGCWILAGAGMTFYLYSHIPVATLTMHNTL